MLNVDSGEELLNFLGDGDEVFSVSSARLTHLFNTYNTRTFGQLNLKNSPSKFSVKAIYEISDP